MKLSVLVITAALLNACSAGPQVVDPPGPFSGAGDTAVYVAHLGWHTGFVLPAPAIQARLPELKERFGDVPYLQFGWGDRDFYQADELNIGYAIKAALWPTETVMHTRRIPQDLANYYAGIGLVKLCTSAAELSSLLDFIAASFHQSPEGQIVATQANCGRGCQFYAGAGQYYLTNTSNTWTAKGLQSLGMDVSTRFKLTADSVMNYLHDHSQAQTLERKEQPVEARATDFSCP